MPRKFFRRYLPSAEAVRSHKYLGRFGPWLHHCNLWHLNRRSVAGGVAVGLFSGLVPGPLQMLAAAVLSILLRVNLPVAVVTTLYTNPITIGPLYVLAYYIGRLIVGGNGERIVMPPELEWSRFGEWLRAVLEWALAMGKPLAVGLVALAAGLAVLGYFAASFAWRAHIVLAWRRRRQRTAARAS